MDSSASASSSSTSQYLGAVFRAGSSGSRPRWPDLPIYESSPHYPSSMENGRLLPNSSASYSGYAYGYGNYSYGGGRGGDAGGGSTAADVTEKREEDEGGGGRSESMAAVEREHMFDKVVTPSDVGKLNRLVIPKQHAEKYFPLDSNTGDSKGLLLNFEDRTGKSWRFRYSYWNSSQSYVMTKGWSRFVKEKKLDAGDIVSFHRGVGDSSAKDRFYIDWRRRPDAPPSHHHHYPLYRGFHSHHHHHHHAPVDPIQFQHGFSLHRPIHPPFYLSPPLPPPLVHQARDLHSNRGSVVSYNGVTTNNSTSGGYGSNYGTVSPNFCHQTGSVIYLGAAAAPQQQIQLPIQSAGTSQRDDEPMVFDSFPVAHAGKAASKRLRLFGVNMDCTDSLDEFDANQQHQLSQHQYRDLLFDNPERISSSSTDSALQLRLHGSGVSAASTSAASDFVDKGKSSMSLDLDI